MIDMDNDNMNNISNKIKIIPVAIYSNANEDKLSIYEENNKKSGIYRWINKINNKSYIGSSISLSGRFTIYYSPKAMKNKLSSESSAIYSAILKYGYSNFSLEILEYCESDKLISREQYYLDLLEPEYNILKIAGSKLGSKHSEITKIKIGVSQKGVNNHMYGKIHTYETRKKISESLKSIIRVRKVNNESKVIAMETRLKLSLRSHSISIKVFDKHNNFVKEFPSIRKAAKYLDISDRTLRRYLEKNKSYNGYTFKSNYNYKNSYN